MDTRVTPSLRTRSRAAGWGPRIAANSASGSACTSGQSAMQQPHGLYLGRLSGSRCAATADRSDRPRCGSGCADSRKPQRARPRAWIAICHGAPTDSLGFVVARRCGVRCCCEASPAAMGAEAGDVLVRGYAAPTFSARYSVQRPTPTCSITDEPDPPRLLVDVAGVGDGIRCGPGSTTSRWVRLRR